MRMRAANEFQDWALSIEDETGVSIGMGTVMPVEGVAEWGGRFRIDGFVDGVGDGGVDRGGDSGADGCGGDCGGDGI